MLIGSNKGFEKADVRVLPRIPDASEVRRELELILDSSVFRGSKRCRDFLRYVSARSLEGAADTLKERTLAVEVFGRHNTGDLADDSIVRVGAREVRKRLAQYYVTDGARDPVRIELPPGSYVPAFHYRDDYPDSSAALVISPPQTEEARPPVAGRRGDGLSGRRVLALVGLAVCLAAVLAIALRSVERRADPFHTFWGPVLNATAPVVIVLPHPIVYHPSWRANNLDLQRHGAPHLPMQRPLDVPPELLNGSDFIPVLDQYVGFGDAVAALRITTLLGQYSRFPKFRLASKVEFNDLRDSTPLLIGAYTNRWALEMTKSMRFRFDLEGEKYGIRDTHDGRFWSLSKRADGRSTEDYVLICRLPHSETGGFMMIGAGINMTGTEEAGRILADPESLSPILRKLPKGWESNNLEFVLHVEVIGDAPVLPQMVAVQSWKP